MDTLSKLKDYTPQDFKQWKESGLTKLFFEYLRDKNEDIKKMVLADFEGWRVMNKENLRTYEQRQAFSVCLSDVMEMDLQSMIDYYEGKDNV